MSPFWTVRNLAPDSSIPLQQNTLQKPGWARPAGALSHDDRQAISPVKRKTTEEALACSQEPGSYLVRPLSGSMGRQVSTCRHLSFQRQPRQALLPPRPTQPVIDVVRHTPTQHPMRLLRPTLGSAPVLLPVPRRIHCCIPTARGCGPGGRRPALRARIRLVTSHLGFR